ncbi:hypothetical protein [Leeia oryzae]|uniref:hypothetical protein n=1 Tax=Leeia oryzae TaxID=356662 RepID=UPI0003A65D82|nr:hypothetical protein [Leeia oryzae]
MSAPRVLKIAFSDSKLPYSSSSCRCGVEYDLLKQMIQDMGYKLEPVFVPNKRTLLLLESGAVDGISNVKKGGATLPGYTSKAYIRYQNVAITLASSKLLIGSLADLGQHRVAAFQNAHINLGDAFARSVASNPNYQEVSPQILQNHLLYGHHTDVVISDLYIFRASNPIASKQVDVTQPLAIYYLFPSTNYSVQFKDQAIRDQFDAQLERVRYLPLYESLTRKYLVPLGYQGPPGLMPEWLAPPVLPATPATPKKTR